MHRVFTDASLRDWEAYATTARGGLPHPGRVVFRALDDGVMRARVLTIDGDLALAEARVASASEDELQAWLETASPLR